MGMALKDRFGFAEMTNTKLAEWVEGAIPFCREADHNAALREAARRLQETPDAVKVSKKDAATVQESIRRVTDGRGCNDADIKRVIALGKSNTLAIGDQTYTVQEIANAIKVAEMFAYHRWGAQWVEESQK